MNKKFPIYRDANQLIIDTELAVRQFPRYHKYTLGSEMRSSAYTILENISLAINQPKSMIKDKKDLIQQAHRETGKFKIKIQLAKSLKLFPNFKRPLVPTLRVVANLLMFFQTIRYIPMVSM